MSYPKKKEHDLDPGTYNKFKIGNTSFVIEYGNLEGHFLIGVEGKPETKLAAILQKVSSESFGSQAAELQSRIDSLGYKDFRVDTNKAIASLIFGYEANHSPLSDPKFIKFLQQRYASSPDPYAAFLDAAKSKIADINNPFKKENSHNSFTIGRIPTNQLVIEDDFASRSHALIVYEEGKFKLKDLQSRNGITLEDLSPLQDDVQIIDESIAYRGDQAIPLPEPVLAMPALRKFSVQQMPMPSASVNMKSGQEAVFALGNVEDVVPTIHVSCDKNGELTIARFNEQGILTNSVRLNMSEPGQEIGGGKIEKAVQRELGHD